MALLWGGGALWAQEVGFAKFSPLPVFATPGLKDGQPRDMEFGAPLAVTERTPLAARIGTGDAAYWVHIADLMMPETERYMAAGTGFGVDKRPVLRFWRSLGVATEFLSASDVRSAAPDLEEIRTDQRLRKLRLPMLARDTVDVMGARPVQLAAVMLPVHGAVATRFDQMRGAQQRRYHVSLVVDASPDAVTFSAETADYLYRQIGRYLRQSGDEFALDLTLFGANFWGGVEQVGQLEDARIRDAVTGPEGPVSDHDEPLLSALHVVAGKIPDTADQRVVIALSGADIVTSHYSARLKKQLSLEAPELGFPPETSVFLAQVTPEPGDGLATLGRAPIRADRVEYSDFSESLGNHLMQRVRDILGASSERPLDQDDLTQICAAGLDSAIPCILPYAPTTASVLPRPTRRGAGADWYTTTVWVVDDGLILRMDGPDG